MMTVHVLLLPLVLTCVLASEPLCSKFSYDEALLEKTIRTEIALEQLKSKFAELRHDVKSAIAKMSEDLQTMLTDIKRSSDEVQKDRKELIEEFSELNKSSVAQIQEFIQESKDVFEMKNRQIERMSGDLRAIYTDIQKNITETLRTPIVGFKATGVKNKTPSVGEVLVFPTVLFNRGNSYNSVDGVFTAPVDGLYLFTIQICMYTKKYMTAQIMVGGEEYGRGYTFDNDDHHPCNTADAIVHMEAGEDAYVKVMAISGSMVQDGHRLPSFAGALVNKGD